MVEHVEQCDDPACDSMIGLIASTFPEAAAKTLSLEELLTITPSTSVVIHCFDGALFSMPEETWTELAPLLKHAVKELPRIQKDSCLRSLAAGEAFHACTHAAWNCVPALQTVSEGVKRRAEWAFSACEIEASNARGSLQSCSTIGVGYVPVVWPSCLRAEVAYLTRMK